MVATSRLSCTSLRLRRHSFVHTVRLHVSRTEDCQSGVSLRMRDRRVRLCPTVATAGPRVVLLWLIACAER